MRRFKTLVAAVVTAAGLVPVGATPAHAMAACHVRVLGTHSEYGQLVAIAGAYRGPNTAVDVALTCGVVRNGGTVARVADPLTGPVAVLGDVQTIYGAGLTSCHEIKIKYLDGTVSYSDTCP